MTNQWVLVGESGRIEPLLKPTQNAQQITEAQYDPLDELLHVVFRDGLTEKVILRQ